MSDVAGYKVTLAVLIAATALAAVLFGHRDRIRATLEELWKIQEVRELSHDAVDTADPLSMGPTRELRAKWTPSKPSLDGVLGEAEWSPAAAVAFDGTDRIRPGVASSRKDSIRDRKTSGLIPRSSNHAVLYLMNDESHVYAAIDVTDDVLDFGEGDVAKRDSVEVYLSDAEWQTARFHGKPQQFLLILGDGRAAVGELPAGAYAAAVKSDASGYIVEMAWKAPFGGQVIGFDVGVNDSDDPEDDNARDQYFWNGTHDSLLSEGRECGRVHLSTAE